MVERALILAAGLGSRLAPITDDRPKSLVSVNGKPIIFKQIENLKENGIFDITVVSGYKADILKKKIFGIYPDINIIESTDYAHTNNMYSAFLGIEAMFEGNEIKPFFMMNADVFFDSAVIAQMNQDERGNLIAVDFGRYMEESMKVIEKDGYLIEISKQISIRDSLGCSIDVYKFDVDGGKAFFDRCNFYINDKRELNLWSEVALNDVLSEVFFYACPLGGRWVEIDNHDDLALAERVFA